MRDELSKNFFDGGKIGIKIEMLFFNVQNEGEFGMKILERPIAFVAFRDKIFAARVPVRVGPENRDFRADVM